MAKTVYDIIKKQNGEKFTRVLRDANLLSIPGLADMVHYAGHTESDAQSLVPYLSSLKVFDERKTDKPGDPFELLHQAGYEYVEYADTLNKQNAIKKYFRPDEELCTFHDRTRYKNYYIVNAVKRNIDSIKPAEYPERQDEYGTSVISIQMLKSGGRISIKNRYNHTVSHPDNTFGSNPDNIIMGLSAALKEYFSIDWVQMDVCLPDNFMLVGDKIIKYSYERNNMYFGDCFYESHGKIYELDKNSQYMLDCFIWDEKQKKLLNPSDANDGFIDAFNNEISLGKKVTMVGAQGGYTLMIDNVPIVKTKNGIIVSVNFPNVTTIWNSFLYHNKKLSEFNAPKLTSCGNFFLYHNRELSEFDAPNLTSVGCCFLYHNKKLSEFNAPKLSDVSHYYVLDNNPYLEVKNGKIIPTKRNKLRQGCQNVKDKINDNKKDKIQDVSQSVVKNSFGAEGRG